MKVIKLTQGLKALVDDEDHGALLFYQWGAVRVAEGRIYARNSRAGYMHSFIMQPHPGLEVDHINGNRLDNRRANLRCVTRSRNNSNRHTLRNKHGYPGVITANTKWFCVRIKVDKKTLYIGSFGTIKDAAKAYRKAYLAAHGEEHPFYR